MADRLGRENQGIEIYLLEIVRRMFRELHVRVAAVGATHASMVATISIGAQETATVSGNHFQPGKAIKRALEDKVRERDGRLQRIADRVAEPAVAGESLVEFGHALRMDEQGHAECLRLGPYRMEFW